MRFADFICHEAILAKLEAVNKEGASEKWSSRFVRRARSKRMSIESIVKAILKREELGSTGIGRGVAVPHTKHPSVNRLVGSVAVSTQGVDFASLDGEVVHLFFLLISPPDRPGRSLAGPLEDISRQLRDDTFCRFLKQAKNVEDIQLLLDEADNNQFGS